MHFCEICRTEKTSRHFDSTKLKMKLEHAPHLPLRCMGCDDTLKAKYAGKTFTCAQCKKEKHFDDFGDAQKKRIAGRRKEGMRCYDCQCPPCKNCEERDMDAKQGPKDAATYYCKKCGPHKCCKSCKKWKPLAAYSSQVQKAVAGNIRHCRHDCEKCAQLEKCCEECGQRKPEDEKHWRTWDESDRKRCVGRCLECEFPQCSNCGGKPGRLVLQTEKADGAWYCSRFRIYDEQLDGRHQTNPRPKQTNEEPKPKTNKPKANK